MTNALKAEMAETPDAVDLSDNTPEHIDWENRRLCSDGNCIGIIGPDGYCKECGRPPEDTDTERPARCDAAGVSPVRTQAVEKNDETGSSDIDWENRRLCSDESCIGVIGPDGRCKECSRPFGGES